MRPRFVFLSVFFLLSQLALFVSPVAAESKVGLAGSPEKFEGVNQLCLQTNDDGSCKKTVKDEYQTLGTIISTIAQVLIVGAVVFFMALILMSGYKMIFLPDKDKALQSAKQNLTTGVMGIIVVAIAWWLTQLLGILTQVDNILGS